MRNMPQNKLAKLKSYNISVLARTQEGTDHRYKRFLKMEKFSKTWKQNCCLFFTIINGWHEEEFGSHFVKNFSGRQHPFR